MVRAACVRLLLRVVSRYTLHDRSRADCMRHQCDHDIYTSTPMRRMRDAQMHALASDLTSRGIEHGLLIAPVQDPVTPLPGCWTRLRLRGQRYDGDVRARVDEPLPFLDDTFELVLLRHALEVAESAPALLAEAVRVVAPGGLLVIGGVHPFSAWLPWFYWRTRGQRRVLPLPLLLQQLLRRSGMDIERLQRIGRTWPGTVAQPLSSGHAGGGYVLLARKRRRQALPLRPRPLPKRIPVNSRLSPSTRSSQPEAGSLRQISNRIYKQQ